MEIKHQMKSREYKKVEEHTTGQFFAWRTAKDNTQLEKPLKIKENTLTPHTNMVSRPTY